MVSDGSRCCLLTHPCREGLGVLLLVAEGPGLDLGAGLEPAETIVTQTETVVVKTEKQVPGQASCSFPSG